MNFFKQNIGKKTYGDIVAEWHKEQKLKSDPNFVKQIAPQFEYNNCIRDFTKANPNMIKKDVITYWRLKKFMSGNNKYSSVY